MKFWSVLAIAAALSGAPALADLIPPPPAPATPDPSAVSEPAGFVRDLYTRYFAALNAMDANPDAARDPSMDWLAIADSHFAPELAERFKKAQTGADMVIDWDFFIDGQDYADLAIISVEAETVDQDKSTVGIVNSNFGQASKTTLDLVKVNGAWRIADFTFKSDTPEAFRLTEVLKSQGY